MGFGFARVRIKGIRISEGLLYYQIILTILNTLLVTMTSLLMQGELNMSVVVWEWNSELTGEYSFVDY